MPSEKRTLARARNTCLSKEGCSFASFMENRSRSQAKRRMIRVIYSSVCTLLDIDVDETDICQGEIGDFP